MDAVMTFLLALWMSIVPLTGDVSGDGQVTLSDIAVLAEEWLYTGPGWPADTDSSEKVDLNDYAGIASQWHHLYREDLFADSGSMANWQVVDEGGIDGPSNWNVSSGQLTEPTNIYGPDASAVSNRKGSFVYWKEPESVFWTDYEFEVALRSTDNDGIGVMFRYRDPQNYYKFDIDSQRNFRKLFKMADGIETTIATAAQGYTVGQTMQLHVTAKGDQITVLLDGVNVFGSAITDSDISSGTAALYNWGNAASYFDNFKIHISKINHVAANKDDYQAEKNTPLEITSISEGVLSNDTVPFGTLTAQAAVDPQHGTLDLHEDGTFLYTPDPNYVGWDHFAYRAVADNGDSDEADVNIRIRSDLEFSIVVLPDPQNYSDYAPQIYSSQTQWIVDHQDELHIAFVLHEGDFTNYNAVREWENADDAMSLLDTGGVPYAAVTGNHDTGAGGNMGSRDVSNFISYFPVARFTNLQGTYEAGHAENSYHYFTAGGTDWLILALEFGPRVKILDWANQIISAHPHRRVIVLTHNYMYSDDTRVGPGDTWNPHDYTACINAVGPEVCNDGEEMWTNFVKLHENISFVFSGHICNDGTGKLVSTGDGGNPVYQMLANYQNEANGGNGWLRIVTFYPEEQKVTVESYSPYLDQYKTELDHQFEFLNVDLTTP